MLVRGGELKVILLHHPVPSRISSVLGIEGGTGAHQLKNALPQPGKIQTTFGCGPMCAGDVLKHEHLRTPAGPGYLFWGPLIPLR